MAIVIQGLGKALPLKEMKNTDFPAELGTSDEWIRSHTGIGSRRIASAEETSASLAYQACIDALSKSKTAEPVTADKIDLIICGTATPDFPGSPSNACLIQNKLHASRAVCFDLTAGCSGFIYAMDTAASMMERHHWRFALVCGAEVLSRIMNWSDRSTCVLFGDGAGAALLENTFEPSGLGIGSTILGTDGTGADKLYISPDRQVHMNGRAVYEFAVSHITDTVKTLLAKEHLHADDLDLIVCHQANERILEAAAKRLKIDFGKFVCNLENYGNTSAASIPITLTELVEQGKLHDGMTILITGFGAGLTWGGAIIRF
nr:beta-ketoacyl-ACP synthase III [uncultured Treponema sp.]